MEYGVSTRAGTPRTAMVLECNGCCGTAEGPRVAVLPCAGAYVSGDRGSNACPAGSVRIETEAACRTAAAAAGKTTTDWSFVETQTNFPRGCYYDTYNTAYFNTHAVGAGNSGSQLLCAATTGAPLHAPVRRRACGARCSRAACLIMQTA